MFLILLFLLNFSKYYIIFFFFNNISFLFWISIDTFDYYISFLVWFCTITVSLLLNLVYSYLFFNNFSERSATTKLFSNNFNDKINISINFSLNNKFTSKHDLSLVLYSWITNNKHSRSKLIVENLFESNTNSKKWTEIYDFFQKLYKISYYLNSSNLNSPNLNNPSKTFSNLSLKKEITGFTNFSNNTNLLTNYFNTVLPFYLKTINNKSINGSLFEKSNLIDSRFEWNLYNFSNELQKYPFLLKTKLGFFFINDLNYSKLPSLLTNFQEFWILNNYLKNQLTVSKWNRWLYRYSILHRKVLKNSHKITLSKKLIDSGLVDSKLFDKNIWNNQYISKYNSLNNFSTLNTLIFGNYDSFNFNSTNSAKSVFSVNQLINNKPESLKFFENSYFWFLKRFYLFNNLSANYTLSKNKILNDDSTLINLKLKSDKHFLVNNVYSFLTKSNYVLNQDLSHFQIPSFLETSNFGLNNLKNRENQSTFLFKDLSLNLNEFDLFSKDNLNLLYLTTTNLTINNKFVFFDYLYSNQTTPRDNILFDNHASNFVSSDLNFYLFLNSLNIDNLYLNDLNDLSAFYQQ